MVPSVDVEDIMSADHHDVIRHYQPLQPIEICLPLRPLQGAPLARAEIAAAEYWAAPEGDFERESAAFIIDLAFRELNVVFGCKLTEASLQRLVETKTAFLAAHKPR
jgi:hypothetical protein